MAQLIKHPQATFMLRVRGNSVKDAGFFDGSIALVDKAIQPRNGNMEIGKNKELTPSRKPLSQYSPSNFSGQPNAMHIVKRLMTLVWHERSCIIQRKRRTQ